MGALNRSHQSSKSPPFWNEKAKLFSLSYIAASFRRFSSGLDKRHAFRRPSVF